MMDEWNYDRELYSAKVEMAYAKQQIEYFKNKIRIIEEEINKQKSKEKIKNILGVKK